MRAREEAVDELTICATLLLGHEIGVRGIEAITTNDVTRAVALAQDVRDRASAVVDLKGVR